MSFWAGAEDVVSFRALGNVATTVQCYLLIRRRVDENLEWINVPSITTTADRVSRVTTKTIDHEGEIVNATVGIVAGGVPAEPGRIYVEARLFRGGKTAIQTLFTGKLYDHHDPSLGMFEGPVDGRGYRHFHIIADDVAGDVTTTFTPAVTNAFRRLLGIVWYYHASGDAATRTLSTIWRRPWGATPTGFTVGSNEDVFNTANPVLTVNEEGSIFMYNGGSSFRSQNDNGVVTLSDMSAVPVPLPLDVREDDPLTILFATTNGHANDRYSAYALIEEWVHA